MYRPSLGFKPLIPASVSAILPLSYVSTHILETYSLFGDILETYSSSAVYVSRWTL